MILIREMIAGSWRLGGDSISCSTPSMRNRMRNSFSYGSQCRSDAPAADRVGQDHVHELDDRRLVGGFLQLDDVAHRRLLVVRHDLEGAGVVGELGQDVGHRRALAHVVALDRGPDGLAGGDDGQDAETRHGGDLVHGHEVGGVGHGQREAVADPTQRQDVVLAGDVLRDHRQRRRVDRVVLDRHRRQAVLLGQDVDQLVFADEPLPGQHAPQPLLRAPVLAQGVLQLLL